MLILAIDTTGFSASLALVKDGNTVLFNKAVSFFPDWKWNDFPYILPKHHRSFLLSSIDKYFRKLNLNWRQIDAIAVSAHSGIYNCVLVGLTVAHTLGKIYNKPVIEVDHILAHHYSTWAERDISLFRFPILVFSASGSHSDFAFLSDVKTHQLVYDKIPIEEVGGVRKHIGIGKLFDQISRMLSVVRSYDSNFPQVLDKLFNTIEKGNPRSFNFKEYYQGALMDLDFTDFMNGIKETITRKKNRNNEISEKDKQNIAASFQESITDILSNKIIALAKLLNVKEIHIAGGVSVNRYFKKKMKEKISAMGGKEKTFFILRYPVKKEYQLDNAAMIGVLAYYQQKRNIKFKHFKPNITR